MEGNSGTVQTARVTEYIRAQDEAGAKTYPTVAMAYNELYWRRTMFEKEIPKHQRMLESELERTISWLKTEQIPSEDYVKTLNVVERLNDMMEKEKPSSVSKETMLTVAANLLGIILIIKHENVNVITSKALGFVFRLR